MAVAAVAALITGLVSGVAPATASEPFSWTGTRIDAATAGTAGHAIAAGPTRPKMAPGTPGVPSTPAVLFEEDFEARAPGSNLLLDGYVGSGGMTYTGDTFWISRANCNGLIVDWSSIRQAGDCNGPGGPESTGISVFDTLAALPYALGMLAGAAAPAQNAAASSFTSGSGVGDLVQFRTETPLELDASGRFVTFSVDAVAVNCFSTHPELRFYLADGATEIPVSASAIDPCDDPRSSVVQAPRRSGTFTEARGGTFAADSSMLFTGDALGIVLRNENGNGGGNDGAYDNIRVLDVTPQLDKSFSPTTAFVDGEATLTFTVTNTSELAAKAGWAFSDALPEGLVVAGTPDVGGTCDASTIADAGSDTITVTGGSLAAGEASCTITVDVTSGAAGSYTNGPANTTETGLNPPADVTIEFVESPTFSCTSGADGLLFQYPTGSTDIQRVNMVTGSYDTALSLSGAAVNAVGYNVLDDFIYGWSQTGPEQGVVRIGADGSVTHLGLPEGGTATWTVTGDVDADGQYWIVGDVWEQIDLAPDSPTFMQVVDSGIAPPWPAGVANVGADWAYVPDGGDYLYSVGRSVGGEALLIRFDPATSSRENLGVIAGVGGSGAFGAVYADSNGFLYASDNADGRIYRIDVQDVTGELFAQGPASSSNDGARCAASPILIDFGDAPAQYGTALGAEGPRHSVIGYDEVAGTADLTLGTRVDPEDDGQPTAAADGDDGTGAADEDGVAEPIVITFGDPATVSVTATNDTSEAATLAGWIDLDGSDTFDADELATIAVPADSGTVEYELAFPAGTVTGDTFARLRLFPASVAAFTPLGAAPAGEVEDHAVTVIERELEIEKSSTMTADSRPGDDVTYTVTATNTGTADYTDESPAVIFDDLSGVLDDAAYNFDAAAEASDGSAVTDPLYVAPSFVSWSGGIAAGESVTVTYTVTLAGGGDGTVRNVAWQPSSPPPPGVPPADVPDCDPRAADGTDPVTGEACATVTGELPKLTIAKTSDTSDLPADGGTVTYTVTVTNQGPGAFSEAAPATMIDDLGDVLDDAAFGEILAPVTGASFDAEESELTWSGPLPVGAEVEISYTVVYDATSGDNLLVNTACVPATDALDPDAACSFVQIPAAALVMDKTVDPADGTTVTAGQDVTYTLAFENTGAAAATVDALDTLTDVLDDATLTAGPTADAGLTATLDDDELRITGLVPVGQTLRVTYTVTVNPYTQQGDHELGNVLGNADGTCPAGGCVSTENAVRHFAVEKAAVPAEGVAAGDVVTYTLTITNDGAAEYTVAEPAVIVDDMADVLDDAAYNGDAVATSDGVLIPAPTFAAPTLEWAGALAVGQVVTITYSVTVTNSGDHDLVNSAGPVCADPEICDPPSVVEVLLPSIVPSKSSDPASGAAVEAGDVIEYTLSFANEGRAPGPVDAIDDLSDVLDDGSVTSAPVVDLPGISADLDLDGESISVSGSLAPGATVNVTYEVTIGADGTRGDNVAGNVLTPDVPPFVPDPDCEVDCAPPFVPPVTEHPIRELDDWKTVDPVAGGSVQPGQQVAYTLHFASVGRAPVTVARDDVLTRVLDDATMTTAPTASDGALTVSAIADGRFSISGSLDPGEVVTVSYTVVVNPDGERGDDRLGNFLVDAGEEPPVTCDPADAARSDCTVNHVSNVVASKTADPPSGTEVAQGERVTYTLSFRNVSTNPDAAPAPIDYTDHLADVLDDATVTDGPSSTDASVSAELSGQQIRVVGAVASGATVTVTYAVTVNGYAEQGDHALGNVVAVTGEEPVCAAGSALCTIHQLTPPPPLAVTGVTIAWTGVVAALTLLILGAGVIVVARRRSRHEETGAAHS